MAVPSRSTIYRRRLAFREQESEKIKEEFSPEEGPYTVHWDGIKVKALTGRKLVERLPVVVTGPGPITEQFLGARVIPNGTGQAQCDEVVYQLGKWDCTECVCALCSDTTSSNTGCKKGAYLLIERALGKPLLYFACRHHLLEVIPKHLFDKLVEASSSPDLGTLCRNFEAAWDEMDKTKFSPATEDPDAAPILSSESVDKALKFCLETVEVHF